MSLTVLGDRAVFWLYVTLICSFFNITLHAVQQIRLRWDETLIWFAVQQISSWRCQQLISCTACWRALQQIRLWQDHIATSRQCSDVAIWSRQTLICCTANQCSGVWPATICTTFITSIQWEESFQTGRGLLLHPSEPCTYTYIYK